MMRTSCTALVVAILLANPVYGQQAQSSPRGLTAEDYVEIRNIAQYYNLGYDNAAHVDHGAILSRVFTPDMVFTRYGDPNWYPNPGLKGFVEYAAKTTPGVHHWDSNIIIEPHPEGASLFRYTMVLHVDDAGTPISISSAGPIYEVYTKTSEGWFIKNRENFSAGGTKAVEFPRFQGRPIAPRAEPAGGGRSSRTTKKASLTALDYVEIENLYGWNNIGLDSAAENGEAFARTFTEDGSMQIDGRTVVGHKSLAELAAKAEPAMHRWLSNLYIEPSAEGAVGWAYLVNLDGLGVPAAGAPPGKPAFRDGGLYRDVLVKTADGWRFKKRVFTPGNTMPRAERAPAPR
jgi:hypothetical protein